jgi:hypothetical protein
MRAARWLRGERDHCKVVEIPTMKDEDAKRPNREHWGIAGAQLKKRRRPCISSRRCSLWRDRQTHEDVP